MALPPVTLTNINDSLPSGYLLSLVQEKTDTTAYTAFLTDNDTNKNTAPNSRVYVQINKAISEVKGYMIDRKAIEDITSWTGALLECCIDIAIWNLMSKNNQQDADGLRYARYKEKIMYLRRVQEGKASITDPEIAPTTAPAQSSKSTLPRMNTTRLSDLGNSGYRTW